MPRRRQTKRSTKWCRNQKQAWSRILQSFLQETPSPKPKRRHMTQSSLSNKRKQQNAFFPMPPHQPRPLVWKTNIFTSRLKPRILVIVSFCWTTFLPPRKPRHFSPLLHNPLETPQTPPTTGKLRHQPQQRFRLLRHQIPTRLHQNPFLRNTEMPDRPLETPAKTPQGRPLTHWRLKIRTLCSKSDFEKQDGEFFSILTSILQRFHSIDPTIRLYPLESQSDDINPSDLHTILETDLGTYIQVKEGSCPQHIDAFLHLHTTFSFKPLKRTILPFLKASNLYVEEYNLQSLDEVHVGWLFGKNCFAASPEGVKNWLNAMLGQSTANSLDYQIQMQQIRFQKFGVNYRTCAWVISAASATAQETYEALTQVLPVSDSMTVGFIGYNALNFATKEKSESIAQYYSQQEWQDLCHQSDHRIHWHRHTCPPPRHHHHFPQLHDASNWQGRKLPYAWCWLCNQRQTNHAVSKWPWAACIPQSPVIQHSHSFWVWRAQHHFLFFEASSSGRHNHYCR